MTKQKKIMAEKTPQVKFTAQVVSDTNDKVFQRKDQELYPFELYRIEDALKRVVSKFFWVPVFSILKTNQVIDDDLIPGDWMLKCRFAITFRPDFIEGEPDKYMPEEYYITSLGLDFLLTLIDTMVWAHSEMLPARIGCEFKKY